MPLRRARRLLPVLLAALVLALAACTGGADDPPSPPATTPIAATATPVAATATMAPTPTATSTPTPSLTPTPTATPVPTETPAPTPTATATPSPTPTATPSPAPTAQPTAFRYGSYDTSGEVAEPGSYAFLAHPADTASAITTYEGLRDGSATALRIHETDAGGVSRAAFLDTVEVGDLFEWRQAEDCWVRYRVIGVEAGSDTRDFAIKSYSHTYTGCSGAIGGSAAREFTWAPEALKTGDFPVPTWHGPWLLIRAGWTGPAPDPSDPSSYAAITPPAITWPPDPLPDPDLGPGWRGGVGPGYGELEGHYSHSDGGSLSVYIFQLGRWPVAIYRTGSPYHQADVINEFRIIDGRPARVSYDRVKDSSSDAHVVIYDEATGVLYNVRGGPISRRNDPEATIAIAKKFILPPAGPPPTSFRYTTYDTTGAVAEPGSYAFLANPADTASAVSTYEALRDGTTTALRIHETDADGVSRAAFLDTVEVGDLFEWRQAEDCFVRYTVTEVLPDPSGTPRKLLGVEWMTYAFTGCSGAVSANADASIGWAPPPVTSPDITSPIRHGPFLLIPSGWVGELQAQQAPTPPVAARSAPGDSDDPAPTWPSTDIAEIRRHPLWSEPDVSEGWTLFSAEADADSIGLRYQDHARHGFVEIHISQGLLLPLYNPHIETSPYGGRIHEATEIDGRPAILRYTPTNDSGLRVTVEVYDYATAVRYRVIAVHWRLSRDYEAVIAIARSLYLDDGPPTPTAPPTTFRYDRYDTTGEVVEPGSYAFLANPADTSSAVTTYEDLRDGSATALRIHETDADGVSRAAFLDTVEAGDLFEWRQAEDCWVRYRLTGVSAASGDTREFAIKSYSHTYTGCSGAIGGSGSAGAQSGRSTSGSATTGQFIWAPVTLKTGAFTAPTWHGPWLVVPKNWTGPVPATALFTGPSISWPPSPLPAPSLGTGWSGSLGRGYPDTELEGIYSHTDGGHLLVYIFQLGRWPVAAYRLSTTYAAAGVIFEFRMIDGRHAIVSYDRVRTTTSQAMVVFYDEATGLVYTVYGGPHSRKNDPEATIDLAKKFILSPAGPPPTSFRYDSYDTTGAVAEPGSYAFLADPTDAASVVTTYEGLRDGTATALRIHETDADGVSRAAFLDGVEVGELFEWRQAEDCWTRYEVTSASVTGTDPATRGYGVKWITYAATGCTGAIAADAAARVGLNPPPFTSDGIAAPVRHGPYLLHPVPWDGELEVQSRPSFDGAQGQDASEHVVSSDLAVVRAHPFWREPDLPDGWTLHMATVGLEGIDGYWALYLDARGGIGAEIWVTRPPLLPKYIRATDGASIYEARTIDGHPARVRYSPAGDLTHRTSAAIFDEATRIEYLVVGISPRASGLPDIVIAAARSLYRPTTSFHYDSYDTTAAVAEPGSYTFLADAGDTRSAVTTYEGLRDGSATSLRIHETDADGVSRAAFLDTVEVGDLFEWREAEDCWVRYRVTSVPAASGTSTREFGVKSFTDAYAGCSGVVAVEGDRRIDWSPPVISSRALTSPVRHGLYHLIPSSWAGTTAEPVFPPLPDHVAAIRDLPCCDEPHPWWREAEVPEGWTLTGVTWGGETDPTHGYSAWYRNEHGDAGVEILVGYWARDQYPWPFPVWADTALVREPRIIDGHHALVQYSPAGLRHEPRRLPEVWLFSEETRMFYLVIAWDPRLAGSDPTATIEIARSLFESPNPP